MKGFATLATTAQWDMEQTKAHALQPCPLSSQSYRNFMWVSVLPFFPTKHICDPLESQVLRWGVAISKSGLCWLGQTASTWK